MIFEGRSGLPVPPLWIRTCTSSLCEYRANVLLIFQCPGICPTQSQVDLLESDNSLAFCPTKCIIVFTWVETRAKSELRVRLVQLNMLKLSSVSFYWRSGVCGGSRGGGGGGQDAIQTSTMTPLSATVSRVSTSVGGCGSGYKCISLSQRVLVYECAK